MDTQRLIEKFTDSFCFPLSRIYFLRATCVFLLFNYAVFWLSGADDYWGSSRLIMPYYQTSYPLFFPFNLLEFFTYPWLWKSFLFAIFPLCIWAFFRPLTWTIWLLLYWVHANLFHATAPLQNAGSNTLLITILLNLLMIPLPFRVASKRWQWMLNAMNHLGFAMIVFQVLILYFVASTTKFLGTKWLDGTAFYFVLTNDIYGHPWFRKVFADNDFITHFVSWFTLVFQLLFPVLVWFRQTKMILLFSGLVFHLMIIWVMGIEDFGLIMMVLYIPFLGEKRLQKVDNLFRKIAVSRGWKKA